MEERKMIHRTALQLLYIFSICFGYLSYGVSSICVREKKFSGNISFSDQYSTSSSAQCWKIHVPENSYVRLKISELRFRDQSGSCYDTYLTITPDGASDAYKFCPADKNPQPITAFNNVSITFSFRSGSRYSSYSNSYYSVQMNYKIESLICVLNNIHRCSSHSCIYQHQVCDGVRDCEDGNDEKGCASLICRQENHFKCSSQICIHQHQVCDGVPQCENGADEIGCEPGVAGIKGVNISRENAILWLHGQRSESFGWGKNTHRAITALYLAGAADFQGDNMEEELMAKQLELQTSVALLRNSTDQMSVSDLSMFINALTVTCHNPRQFYGYDLLQILGERLITSKSPCPAVYLTLCNADWNFSRSDVDNLLEILDRHSEYPFHLDIQAMAVMALACVQNKTNNYEDIQNATKLHDATIQQLLDNQLPDGNFGNIYTTALVAQALLSSGQENNELWKMNSTVNYLMRELNSSADFLSVYLALPVFNGKSLVDVTDVNCTNIRKHSEDDDISDVTNKLGGKMRIQYSLYVGDQKDVIHTMYLRMPENSSAYDVMRMAQVVDHKYKFLHRDVSGRMYVYSIAGITNDPEAGKFWFLYSGDSHVKETVKHHSRSPDKYILHGGEHLIMWYKTAHM